MEKKFETQQTKPVGKHKDCGGDVNYISTARIGFRVCAKCQASSLKGNPMELERE